MNSTAGVTTNWT